MSAERLHVVDEHVPAPPEERTLDDIGNAHRLVDQHGDDIRYVPGLGWLTWTGQVWRRDVDGALVRMAKSTVDSIYLEAMRLSFESEERKRLLKHATQSGSARAVKAMIELAQADLRVIARPEDLDRHPHRLCVENGVIDLESGQLEPHDPRDLITKLAPVAYDPNAAAPTFERFIAWAMQNDPERMRLLQRAFGYALTGTTSEQVLFILIGVGANGKSTLVELFLELLGDYAAQTPPGLLLDEGRRDGPSPETLVLRGARLVATSETGDGGRFDEPRVKRLTGGDTLAARLMRSNHIVEFRPEFKLFLATNSLPRIREGGHSIWRRIHLLPFHAVVGDDERDGTLPEKLRAEMPGVLRWAIEGCLAWQADGLGRSAVADLATAEYRASEDQLVAFIAECCELRTGARSRSADLYSAYETWAKSEREEVMTKTLFGRKLDGIEGVISGRTKKFRGYSGIRLNSDQETLEGDG